ncbi:hypothetical protein [Marinicella meishanensis]|uniref:hypothetical protein n=1 Tax=Marinicella meishanensis TaxID=2873263 RepID=UPI001CBC9952|nr:hypothetical protein [Marinicella sp. NBU2979]
MKTCQPLTQGATWACGLLWAALANAQEAPQTMNLTPVLDGHAYQLNGDVMIDFANQIIHFNSDMTECLQANGQPPLDTLDWAAATNLQFIGLQRFSFNTSHNNLYLSSETADVLCDNAVYVDTLFANGFD